MLLHAYNSIEIENKSSYKLADYDNIMYPEGNESGFVAIALGREALFKQIVVPVGDWTKWVQLDKDCFVSVNTYYRRKRDTRSVRHLNAFYVDLDYYDFGLSLDDVLNAIEFYVKTERIPMPTIILDSGRGAYAIWKIESVPGAYKQTKNLYNHIQQYICDLFRDFGADPKAKDIARILRVPFSINTKVNKRVEIIKMNSENVYTMKMFKEYVDPFEEYAEPYDYNKKAVKKTKSKKSKIKYLFTVYSLNKGRCADLERLCELRDYNMTGYRNRIVHMYTYFLFCIHECDKIVTNKVQELNDEFTEPLSDKELRSIVRTCKRAYDDHLKDYKKGYNYKHETIIELLEITLDEQQHMATLISPYLKNERQKATRKAQRRNDEGLTKRQADKAYMLERVQQLIEAGYKQKQIAEILEVSKGRVSQIVKELNKKV